MEIAEVYANVPIELSNQKIRLVEILPGLESDVIHCRFHCVSLVECPEYVALSYAWGVSKSLKFVLLDGVEFPVGRNLWWFLYYARIRGSETQLFWIDALCIDQSNNLERSHQVRLMGRIYTAASSVMIWLGETDKEVDSDLAMDFINKKGLAPLQTKADRFLTLWSLSEAKALLSLCERSYWKRVWVVQEIMHAKDLTVFCGSRSFSWRNIYQIFQNLRKISERGQIVHHQNAGKILDSPASVLVQAKSVYLGDRVPLLYLLETHRDLQSTEVRDKVIGLLGLASSRDPTTSSSLVDYSIPIIEFFWRVLTWIWQDSRLSDQREMLRAAESLKDILRVYVPENELNKKIKTSTMLASSDEGISYDKPSNFSSTASTEGWTKISDLAESRRIQNRIAQRNYRQKLKRRLEDLERRAGSSSASPPPETLPDQYVPPGEAMSDPFTTTEGTHTAPTD